MRRIETDSKNNDKNGNYDDNKLKIITDTTTLGVITSIIR
jgi:hypothetical protein